MLEERHRVAARQIEEILSVLHGVRELRDHELNAYARKYARGWEIPGLCKNEYRLRVLIEGTLPFTPARVAVTPAPPLLSWPHLEDDGMLCLLPDTGSCSIDNPGSVVVSLLEDGRSLVEASLRGEGLDAFEDEFASYWGRWNKTTGTMWVLCRPESPSRWVSATTQTEPLVADDETTLRSWLRQRYSDEASRIANLRRIPLIWLPRALRPLEYPTCFGSLMDYLSDESSARTMLEELVKNDDTFKAVLLGFSGRSGAGFAGLQFNEPKHLNNGFPKRPPDSVLLSRYRSAAMTGMRVRRVDPSWVHGRDHNTATSALIKKSVVIIGVGSLGSAVAELLAKAGVGMLQLVDPQALESENVARHALGIPSVGKNKAREMARDLTTRFPHLNVCGFAESMEEFAESNMGSLRSADLVVSATASWRAESLLNAIQASPEPFPPVLYCWMEPFAAAGHAIVFFQGNGCLRCITDDLGKRRTTITTWPTPTTKQTPGCGALFQPYGAAELAHMHAMVTNLILEILQGNRMQSTHRVWIGSQSILERENGQWNPAWIACHGDPGTGGMIREFTLQVDPSCTECNRML